MSNTCGIDFHFANDIGKRSRVNNPCSKTGKLTKVVVVDAEYAGEIQQQEDAVSIFDCIDEEDGALLITNEILHKLFVKQFRVVSENGKWVYQVFLEFYFVSEWVSRWVDPDFSDEEEEEYFTKMVD